ncbi:MAG: tetratricopeptide repeat protein [Planctomycetes bacterium]|nr:tetratricopeptide repeat protein [Planctomycetota bacterium]
MTRHPLLALVVALLSSPVFAQVHPAPHPSPAPRPAPVVVPRPTPSPSPAPRPIVAPSPRPTPAPRIDYPSRPTPTPAPRIDYPSRPAPTPAPRIDYPSRPTPIPTPRAQPTPRYEPPARIDVPSQPRPVQPRPTPRTTPRVDDQPRVRVPGPGTRTGDRVAPKPAPDYGTRLRDLYDRRTPPKDTRPAPVDRPSIGDAPRLRPVDPDRKTPVTKTPTAPRVDAPRRNPPIADRRYPVPGRSVQPVDVVSKPSPRLSPPRVNPPHVNPPRTSPPTVRPTPRPSPTPRDPRYDGRTYSGSSRWYWGSWQWSGHCATFTPSYSRWGCYSYPYWYSSWWCRNWYDCNSSFVLWWNSCSPSLATVSYANWWWPSDCYLPGSWLGWGYSQPYVVTMPLRETVVVARAEPEPEPESEEEKAARDLRTLADRHLRLGDWYFKQARFDEAAESYMRALAYAPDDGSIHFVIADALFATADYHYAAYMIRKGIEFDAGLVHADADKRAFYGDGKVFDAQVAALEKYCADKPYDAAAQLVLAYNLRFSGRSPEALTSFRRVLEIAPGDPAARAFLEALADASGKSAEPSEAGEKK